jgi:hypothetical protein
VSKLDWRRAKLAGRRTLDGREELGPDARDDAAARWLARHDGARAPGVVVCARCGHRAAVDVSRIAGRTIVCSRCGQRQRSSAPSYREGSGRMT